MLCHRNRQTFYKVTDSRYSQFCGLCGLCCSSSFLPSWLENGHRQSGNGRAWLGFNKILLTKTSDGLDLIPRLVCLLLPVSTIQKNVGCLCEANSLLTLEPGPQPSFSECWITNKRRFEVTSFLSRNNFFGIESTYTKWTVQWFLVYLQHCATIIAIQFYNIFISPKSHLVPLKMLTPCPQP